jgi:hypothetical protein
MAVILDIADAVVAELNAASFSLPFTAVRHYQPKFDLMEMKTLHVSVVPRSILAAKTVDRNQSSADYLIDVGVQQKTDLSQASLDGLMALVEEIAAHFGSKPLAGYPAARCMAVKNEPIYFPDHLEQLRQFTSVLTLTFRVWR